jgi:hypothetical protein
MVTPTNMTNATNETPTTTPIVARIKALHDRLLKAEILVAYGKVHQVVDMEGHYLVEGIKEPYLVKDGKCSCPDAASRNGLINGHCKHVLATMLYQQELGLARPSETKPDGPATDKGQDIESKISDLYN